MMTTVPQLEKNPVVQALISDQAKFPQSFQSEILSDDEMFLFNLTNFQGDRDRALIEYYTLGRHVLDAVRQIVNWRFGGWENVSSFLDFASGCGRFIRFLVQEIPKEKIWISDIQANAVKFQSEYFEVNGILSKTKPEEFSLDRKFDCILSISLFSHLPEKTFSKWLENLYKLLISTGGIFLFSVHDEALLPSQVKRDRNKGIFFIPESESYALDKEEYGTTYVTEEYVRKVLTRISGGKALVHRIKEGVSRFQDLYIVTNEKVKDFADLHFSHHPEGFVDAVELTPHGKLHLGGWGADFNEGGKIKEVQIIIDGKIVERTHPEHDRVDVASYYKNEALLHSGWSCDIDLNITSLDSVVLIKVINHDNLETILEVSTVKSMFQNDREAEGFLETQAKLKKLETELGSTQNELEQMQQILVRAQTQLEKNKNHLLSLQTQLEEAQGELVQSRQEKKQLEKKLTTTENELEQATSKLEEIEKSKFWQMRNAWFKAKKTVGLIDKDILEET
jgi:hypothetical protein